MQDIGSLLKDFKQGKNEISLIKECIENVTGIKIIDTEIVFSTYRDVKKVSFKISGAKKTVLLLNKEEVQRKLSVLGFILN